MEVYDYPQFSLQAAICLFTDVKNGPEIRKKIVEAATCQGEEGETLRNAVNFAFVDARVVSRSPLPYISLRLNGAFCEDHEQSAPADCDLLRSISSEPRILANENSPFGNPVGTQPR